MKRFRWKNIRIGGKFLTVFFLVAVVFLISILLTYTLSLQGTSQQMEKSAKKNQIAIEATEVEFFDFLIKNIHSYPNILF